MKSWRKRLITGTLAIALAAGGGLTAPSKADAMSAIFPPCDGFMDCIYTANWYYFHR
ncbi:hypothetical protein [Paenibacillus silviterrae]|uniref:hypothetical protein n=1 Tax=Paenibacillus silviterrae TaxID=3242194 RepID=UPI0025429688|nr:hypothetical protein [Paenibacillus chinjuensis]